MIAIKGNGNQSAADPRRRAPLLRSALAAAALAAFVPAVALAHAVVLPERSTPSAYEKYVLRVPNEAGSATTRVEIRFPAGVRVLSFADVPGWEIQVLTDSAGRVTGAVWTGTLPAQRFVEFPFVALNPSDEARLVWPAYQTYADGERVEWTGPEESERPASSTIVRAVSDRGRSDWAFYMSAAAIVLALVGLGVALRPRTRT